MPKYYTFKVANHYLYFTVQCIVEAMHVHASDKRLTESNSLNFLLESMEAHCLKKEEI